jgi:hypothetical protein
MPEDANAAGLLRRGHDALGHTRLQKMPDGRRLSCAAGRRSRFPAAGVCGAANGAQLCEHPRQYPRLPPRELGVEDVRSILEIAAYERRKELAPRNYARRLTRTMMCA